MTSVSHPRGPRPSPRGASRVIDGVLRVRRVGTRFARAWFALALAFPLMHCIVLDPTSSIPEPLPPVLSSPPSAAAEGVAMDQIIEVRRTDGDGQTDLQIPLVLTYADDRVDFRYRVFTSLPGMSALLDDLRVQEYQGQPVLTWSEAASPVGYGFGHFVIADASYTRIADVQVGNGYTGGDVHEFLLTPRGTALVIIYHPIEWDASPIGGSRYASVLARTHARRDDVSI